MVCSATGIKFNQIRKTKVAAYFLFLHLIALNVAAALSAPALAETIEQP
jgi:hypothetical protein